MSDSTERFSSRVENYVRYRPHYPPGVLEFLQVDCGFSASSIVADIGSGTGILSEMFLTNGNTTFGVEPNGPMRHAAESLLKHQSRFHSVNGTAERTTLPAASVDFVTAGQAFHWFKRDEARLEFQRILKPDGWVVLIWNERALAASAFGTAYDQFLIQFATEYEVVNQRSMSQQTLAGFFANGFTTHTLANSQRFDFEGLKGRLLSSSYAPEPGHPQYDSMITSLRVLFDSHEVDGEVIFEYDTNLYYGRL